VTVIWMICPATTVMGVIVVPDIVPPYEPVVDASQACAVMVPGAVGVGGVAVEAMLQPLKPTNTFTTAPACGAVMDPASVKLGMPTPEPKVALVVSPPTQT